MRRLAPLLIFLPLLAAASAPVQPAGVPLETQLRQARAEQSAAEAEAARLEQISAKAIGEAARLRAEQAASAQNIEAAEARITAADTQLRLASAYVAAHRQRLAEEQRPVASLLAGLAIMAQRPPLLSIAGQNSADDLVKVRILLDSTLPVIRSRTAKLSAQLTQGQRLEQVATAARAELVQSRRGLVNRRQQFAALEQRALRMASASGGQALSAGDVAIAVGENLERLRGSASGNRSALALAAALANAEPAPARPVGPDGQRPAPPFAYQLPASAAVTEGLDAVNASGVRSRGLTLATFRGAPVTSPAQGLVRFAGPFRDYDGILIIDHGHGWMSLIVNVATDLKPGERVAADQPVGRALGPIAVELSQNGRRISPALIAGSSQTLSNPGEGR
ncbi:MAG: murein hydrolase activator [Sphingomonadales bacterium]|nr:murein hydrolase activator [Sphingomonadales bacterium]